MTNAMNDEELKQFGKFATGYPILLGWGGMSLSSFV